MPRNTVTWFWWLLFSLAWVCPSAARQGGKRFCDPSPGEQTGSLASQKCGSGFYREWSGPRRGQCVPCSCNGLSDRCDELTGKCVNCRFHSTGGHCERCQEGYHGNATQKTCRACPCPFTWNNRALACLDVGSGAIECLCKRGYAGSRCGRCAFGYYGDPEAHGGSCEPCQCGAHDGGNGCHALTGECTSAGNSTSAGLKCCADALLLRLRANEGDLRGPTHISASVSTRIRSQRIISDAETLVKNYSGTRRRLDLKVEQLEEDMNTIQDDLDQLSQQALQILSRVNESLSENRPKTECTVLLNRTESVLASLRDLIKGPGRVPDAIKVGGRDGAAVMEDARRLVEEMNRRGRVDATAAARARGQKKMAKKLLDAIAKMAAARPNQQTLNQTADSLAASRALFRNTAAVLSGAKASVRRARRVRLKSATTRRLQRDHDQTVTETRSLLAATESTRRDPLQKIGAIFLELRDAKHGFEKEAAQLDGAERQLRKRLSDVLRVAAKMETVGEAEEHARELSRLATDMQKMHPIPTFNTTKQPNEPDVLNSVVEDAAIAANRSGAAADEALQDATRDGRLLATAALRDDSTRLWTAANRGRDGVRELSQSLNVLKDGVTRQKEKGESLRFDISRMSDRLKSLKTAGADVLVDSAKRAASATNETVAHVTHRLRNIRQEMDRLTLNNSDLALNDILDNAQQAVRSLETVLPMVREKFARVEALGKTSPPSGNVTENIRRIRDLVQETRSYLNRLSLATLFNGKGHIELRPPSTSEDVKAFTAIELLLGVDKTPAERGKRREKRRDNDMFVLYLGAEDGSGDYVGMAIRRGVLICVYKLGGDVHQVATSPITTFSGAHTSSLDRVVFHRLYHDAEVNVTANFTSERPVPYAPKRHQPDTVSGILDLAPQRTVFYVGGYPPHFNPPEDLRFPRFRGYMKLSYINNEPLCLYNYKRAVNMQEAGERALTLPSSEVSDYYPGNGYREASVKEPHKRRKRLFKFHTNSRDTDSLLFYMGAEEAFWCLQVEEGHLVLQGQQAGIKQRARSADKVSLFDKHLAITVEDKITVHFGDERISIEHVNAPYRSFYIGGVPEHIRTRHEISAPPLTGCVDHVSADGKIVEYNTTMGVSDGCPSALLGVRTATLHSPLSADWIFAPDRRRFAFGFRSTHKHGVILRSSSQSSFLGHISLVDGYLQLSLARHDVTSSKRYDDGSWHYLCVVQTPRLLAQIDNIDVTFRVPVRGPELNQGEEFKVCIANLYSRSVQRFTPVDLSSLAPTGGVALSRCRLASTGETGRLATDESRQLQMHKLAADQTDGECGRQRAPRRGYELAREDSWLAYKLPQQDLNYRPHFSLDVKTKSSKGVILFVEGTGAVPLLVLYVTNGKIKMSLGPSRVIHHKLKTNDGHWHRVECSVERNTFHLLVDGIRVTDGHLPDNEGSSLNFHGHVYLGGRPGAAKGPKNLLKSILGCVRDFRMNDQPVGNPEGARGVSPCSDGRTERGMYFAGGHVVSAIHETNYRTEVFVVPLDDAFAAGAHFTLTFELRPRRPTGLLFHARGDGSSFDVFLINNTVGVSVNDGGGGVNVALTPQNICDGEFHVITVSKEQKDLMLTVDGTSEKKARPFPSFPDSMTWGLLHIGGASESSGAPVTSPYTGCLRNVTINGRRLALEGRAARAIGPVDLDVCPAH
ncbi:laminin subunit alpha-3 isoform X2 [Syngnathoides biaculeatus]|uniref:laminin subunit alpha-3 isoform X2 n=1 Tax=Syngnathoides biaculeatus TaxID=300417 RepID=UPI002ADE2E3B|nr:laminin subunit alpha-3 isoform X2 [Syngnathoides biaculeatus]